MSLTARQRTLLELLEHNPLLALSPFWGRCARGIQHHPGGSNLLTVRPGSGGECIVRRIGTVELLRQVLTGTVPPRPLVRDEIHASLIIRPGQTPQRLADDRHRSDSTIRGHLRRLEQEGRARRERIGRETHWHPKER